MTSPPDPATHHPETHRAKRRREAYLAIHQAAYHHAIIRGHSAVTVEAIAADAGVSPRTFFNYFPTKDDAIIGIRPPCLTEGDFAVLTAHPHTPLLERTAHLLIHVIRSTIVDLDTFVTRKEHLASHPELRSRLNRHVHHCELTITDALAAGDALVGASEMDQLAATGPNATRALTALAGAVVRHAFTQDPTILTSDPTDQVAASLTTIKQIVNLPA